MLLLILIGLITLTTLSQLQCLNVGKKELDPKGTQYLKMFLVTDNNNMTDLNFKWLHNRKLFHSVYIKGDCRIMGLIPSLNSEVSTVKTKNQKEKKLPLYFSPK